MITEVRGDLLRDDAEALVNPVNTVGVMSLGGIADLDVRLYVP